MVFVSYIDSLHYCEWAGLSLPTEWLWEKAARGSDGRPYPWGDAVPTTNLGNIVRRGTRPVGSYPGTRTPYGCEDLIGNVSEWCLPCWERDFERFPGDRIAAERANDWEEAYRTNRRYRVIELGGLDMPSDALEIFAVVRGGSFLRSAPRSLSAYHRRRLAIVRRNRWTGFRPASFLSVRPAL